jgi:hypothetical protein
MGKSVFERSPKAMVEPTLGVDLNGRVTGMVPGCLLDVDVTTSDGKKAHLDGRGLTAEGLPRATVAPLIPHATTLAARTCESCHTSPTAVGYGVADSREATPIEDTKVERPLPGQRERSTPAWESESVHGDEALPEGGGGGEKGFIEVGRMVTREGQQLRHLADQGEHPLTLEQRDAVEREGVCLACHKHAGEPAWAEVMRRLGPAKTPEAHGRAIEALFQGFVDKPSHQ